jgi:hypothetical protein
MEAPFRKELFKSTRKISRKAHLFSLTHLHAFLFYGRMRRLLDKNKHVRMTFAQRKRR